jgi:hypothetical protein
MLKQNENQCNELSRYQSILHLGYVDWLSDWSSNNL